MKKLKNNKTYISNIIRLMMEWNFSENLGKDPTKYEVTSNESVSWVCVKGHVWMDTIKNRYAGGVCPGCNNERKLISGVNDLATMRP